MDWPKVATKGNRVIKKELRLLMTGEKSHEETSNEVSERFYIN